MKRRRFLTTLGAAVPATSLAARHKPDATSSLYEGPLDAESLRAIGTAILPSRLGAEGVVRVANAFQRWLAEYRPGAELLHGYGTDEIRAASEGPADRWQQQLGELQERSHREFGAGLSEVRAERLRELIRGQLVNESITTFPAPARARHVAVGLLAFFYASPEATDLCYDASIRKNACRPLSQVSEEPT